MVDRKIVFGFSQSKLNREDIFYCLKELLYRNLASVHCRLLTVALILFFSLPIPPRERLPTIAPEILDSMPKVYLQIGGFFNSNEEFKLRINTICFQICKIQAFAKFVQDNPHRIKERHLVYADLSMFADFLSMFLTKEFVDPKGMFQKTCRQHRFEFLMFDFCRE